MRWTARSTTDVFRELQATAGADFVVELVDTFFEEAPRCWPSCAMPVPRRTPIASGALRIR